MTFQPPTGLGLRCGDGTRSFNVWVPSPDHGKEWEQRLRQTSALLVRLHDTDDWVVPDMTTTPDPIRWQALNEPGAAS